MIIQFKVFLGILIIAFTSPSLVLAQSITVHELLDSCYSKNGITVFTSIKSLQKLNKQSFDTKSIIKLKNLLLKEPVHIKELIKVAGFAEMEEFLQEFITYKKWDKSILKTINLALVRSGNEVKTNSLVKGVSKIPTSDAFVYEVVPSLVYTRQKAVMDNLLERIMETGEKCFPADLETEGNISCAFPIIEQIAPYIIDFPVETDKYGIMVEDYDEMLKKVRKWIKEKKGGYSIDFEKY